MGGDGEIYDRLDPPVTESGGGGTAALRPLMLLSIVQDQNPIAPGVSQWRRERGWPARASRQCRSERERWDVERGKEDDYGAENGRRDVGVSNSLGRLVPC